MEFEKLRDIIVEVLNVDESAVKMESTFVDDLGADSLDVFQIIMGLEEEFDIEIPNEEAEKIVTVGDAVDYLKKVFLNDDSVTLWTAAIDEELTTHSYIVPGLGDAGDLAYGEKI